MQRFFIQVLAREYSDKMNTYLFGPTFKVLIDKKQDNDPVNFLKL